MANKNKLNPKITLTVSETNQKAFYAAKAVLCETNPLIHNNDGFIVYLLDLISNDQILKDSLPLLKEIAEQQDITLKIACSAALQDYAKKVRKSKHGGQIGHSKTIAADNLLDEVVRNMMRHNDSNEKSNQIYINANAISKFSKNEDLMSNYNMKIHSFGIMIKKRYLVDNADLITKHHEKHGLVLTHNSKIACALRNENKVKND
jgi:hypothetical protein